MRLTYTDLETIYAQRIGATSGLSTDQRSQFQRNMGARYQVVLASLQDYMTAQVFTDATVDGTQFYSYPPGIVNIDDVVVTVGSVRYPLSVISSQHQWDIINAIQIQASTIPQFLFPRRDDYGIWPTPQDVYTITFNYHYRDRNLMVADSSSGTVTCTNGSAVVVGSGGLFSQAMVGRWFTVTATTDPGHGYWYRIASVADTDHLTLTRTYVATTNSAVTYRIGETPEIPEEGHICLVDGATADWYADARDAGDSAKEWENKFYTGDRNNPNRQMGNNLYAGGIFGLMNRYSDRNDVALVKRKQKLNPLPFKVFATTLTA